MAEQSMRVVASVYAETVSTTALTLITLGFTADQVAEADAAHITVEGNDIRYTYDGTTPEAAVGHPVAAGGERLVRGGILVTALQFIRVSADATINISLLSADL